jgi:iron complex transport system substrate-binding protein
VGRSLVNHSRGPLPEYRQAVEAIPQLNYGSATREAVLSSGADFIYALDWEIGGGVDLEEAAQYGMTVYINSAVTLEQQYQEIRDIGRIFGAEQAAEAFVAQQEARIQAVQDKIGGREPVKVLVYDSGNDGVFTCSGVNFESLLIGLAGGQNLFDDLEEKQWVTVSYEEVLLRQPDVILIHDYDSPSLEEKIAEIQANPTLAQLDCVKNQRFASITLESVLPGDRMAYAVEQMAQDFYPDLWQ